MKRRNLDLGLLRLHNASRMDASAAEVLSGAARAGEVNHLPRLLRRTPDLRYVGLIHEDVSDWLMARGMRLDQIDADIVHLGGVPALRGALGKRARNLALLEKRCRLEPDSVVPVGYLAMEHWDAGEVEQARAVADRGWEMLDRQPSHRSAYLVGAARAFCQVRAGDGAGLAETVTRMVQREGRRRDFAFLAAVAMELSALRLSGPARREGLEGALRSYQALMKASYSLEQRTFVAGATSWSAQIRAGTILLQLGRAQDAREAFLAALAEVPENEEATLGAAEADLDRGDAAGVTARLAPLLAHGHERPDGWLLATAATIQAAGSKEEASRLMARAKELEPKGWVAHHRAARLRAMNGPPRADPASALLAALMERRPVPVELAGARIGDAMLRAVAQAMVRTGRAGLLEPLLSPAAAEASPGLPGRLQRILEELGRSAPGGRA
jgi:tetratricopeptide (TPR) repeat protein